MQSAQITSESSSGEIAQATLEAQIRARISAWSEQRLTTAQSASFLSEDTVCSDLDVRRALDAYRAQPDYWHMVNAMATLLLQATAKFAAALTGSPAARKRWDNTGAGVVLFELSAYLWSVFSAGVRDSVRHALEEDRDAVNGVLLRAFSAACETIRERWPDFTLEAYTLSRVLLYPRDADEAIECLASLLASSIGLSQPLSADAVRLTKADAKRIGDESGLLPALRAAHNRFCPELCAETLELAAHYLAYRID